MVKVQVKLVVRINEGPLNFLTLLSLLYIVVKLDIIPAEE